MTILLIALFTIFITLLFLHLFCVLNKDKKHINIHLYLKCILIITSLKIEITN